MISFSISPSVGTFSTQFSAILSGVNVNDDFLINWGDDEKFLPFTSDWLNAYSYPGHYLVTLDTCSGTIFNHLSVLDLFEEGISVTINEASAFAGCPVSFTVRISSKEEKNNLNFYLTGTQSSIFKKSGFWQHLVPQYKFLDSGNNVISSYEVTNTLLSNDDFNIGYISETDFFLVDDLPNANNVLVVEFQSLSANCYLKNFTFLNSYYQLTPLKDFSIAFLADAGVIGTKQRSAVSALSSQNPDFWIIGGDNSYNHSAGNLAPFYSALSAFTPFINQKKIARVLGNHDWDDGGIVADNRIFGLSNYYDQVLNDGMIHLFVLDSGYDSDLTLKEVDGVIVGSKQYNWFVDAVRYSQAPFKVVAFHHPFIGTYSTSDSKRIFPNMDWKFENFGIDLILNGHIHNTEIQEYKGMSLLNCSRPVQSYDTPNFNSPYTIYNAGSGRYVSEIDFYPTKFQIKLRDLVGNLNYTYTKSKNGSSTGLINTTLNLSGLASAISLNEYYGNFTYTKMNSSPFNVFLSKVSL